MVIFSIKMRLKNISEVLKRGVFFVLFMCTCALGAETENFSHERPPENLYNNRPANKDLGQSLTDLESIVIEQNEQALKKEMQNSQLIKGLSHTHLHDDQNNNENGMNPLFNEEPSHFHYSWKLLMSLTIILFVSVF